MTKRKQIPSFLPGDAPIPDLKKKILSQGFIREIRTWVRFWRGRVWKQAWEDERLPNKSIKELKAENNELAVKAIKAAGEAEKQVARRN